MDKIKIMFLSDSPTLPTGYARISRDLAYRLAKMDFEVTYVGINYHGPELENYYLDDPNGQQIELPYRLLPCTPGINFGAANIQYYLNRFKPDILFCLLDSFMLMAGQPERGVPFGWWNKIDLTGVKFVMYYPSDGGGFPDKCEQVLKRSIYPIAMAKFGQKQVADEFGIWSDYIPHHVRSNIFYPVTEQEREDVRRQLNLPLDTFIFGSVARHQPRKAMESTLWAFSEFMKRNPQANACLMLHSDPKDNAGMNNLEQLAIKMGIRERIVFTLNNSYIGIPTEKMRLVYGAMDVHVLTTTGEGFGIPTIEAMACGVPSIITNYTTTEELIRECGWPVDIGAEVIGNWMVKRAFVSIPKFVDAMEDAYYNRDKLKKFGQLSREKVLREYDFESVVLPRWVETLKKIALQ